VVNQADEMRANQVCELDTNLHAVAQAKSSHCIKVDTMDGRDYFTEIRVFACLDNNIFL
jgi:hypothetical protein